MSFRWPSKSPVLGSKSIGDRHRFARDRRQLLTNSRRFATNSKVAKRPWKETKVSISLPNDVLADLDAEAAGFYKSTAQFLRDLLIERTRAPQPVAVAPVQAAGARGSRSGFKGVYAYGKRWETVIYVNGSRRRLGVYDAAETAARAYDDFLVAQANDPNAAVNFPTPADSARATNAPFVERFASSGKLTDIEWGQWKDASKGQVPLTDAALSVAPDGPRIDSSTPLIERPVKTLYRRDSVPSIAPPIEDPDAYPEPDEGPPEHVS